MTSLRRKTRETNVSVAISTHEAQLASTSVPFLDHMLVTLGRYAGFGLRVEAGGDLKHHIVEDVAIVLGAALREHAPVTCARYGSALVPMDDALVQCAIDLGGRMYYRGPLPSRLYDHFMRSLSCEARATIHLRVLRGKDRHHIVEAAFKALGLSLRSALADTGALLTTKGAALTEVG